MLVVAAITTTVAALPRAAAWAADAGLWGYASSHPYALADELLRVTCPTPLLPRVAAAAADLRPSPAAAAGRRDGCPVRAGERMLLIARHAVAAHRIDPDPLPAGAGAIARLVFGIGPHACPGARLARAQLADLLTALAPYRPAVVSARVDRRAALPSWRSLVVRAGIVKIAVTGASGFCGAAVARLAAASGAEVLCVGRRPGPVGAHVRWDATRDTPDLSGAQIVIHLAAAVGDPGTRPARGGRVPRGERGRHRAPVAAAGDRPVVWVSSASVYRPGPYPSARREPSDRLPAQRLRPHEGTRRTGRAGGRRGGVAAAGGLRAGRPPPAAAVTPYDPRRPCLAARSGRPAEPDRRAEPGGRLPGRGRRDRPVRPVATRAYNIADDLPYRRDSVVAEVLGVPVGHVPIVVARALAAGAGRLTLPGRPLLLTQYAIDQLTDGMILDIARARSVGWTPPTG